MRSIPVLKIFMKNIIIISGAARSGTSILGKIIGSCNKVEYFYEPETFLYLSYIKNKISKKIWKTLIKRNLEENLLSLINGRSLNYRKNENSSITSIKSPNEIKKKFQNEVSELNLNNYIKQNKIKLLIKSPNIKVSSFHKEFSNYKLVVITRNPYHIINSLIKRNWFKNKNYLKTFLPSIKISNSLYPIWMKKKYVKLWKKSNEFTKCAIYLLCCKEEMKAVKNKIIINYDELVKNPHNVVNSLIKKLNLTKTQVTNKLLKGIKITKSAINTNESLIRKKIPSKILKQIEIA